MTTQADYCRNEWDLIIGTPGLIALVIIQAEQWSQTTAYQKLRTLIKTITETSDQEVGSDLIHAVTAAVRAGQSPLWPTECPCDLDDTRAWAVNTCRQVSSLLGQKVPEAEADAYAHWLMRLAQQILLAPAQAGYADMNLRQRATLDEIAAALGVPFAVDAPLLW